MKLSEKCGSKSNYVVWEVFVQRSKLRKEKKCQENKLRDLKRELEVTASKICNIEHNISQFEEYCVLVDEIIENIKSSEEKIVKAKNGDIIIAFSCVEYRQLSCGYKGYYCSRFAWKSSLIEYLIYRVREYGCELFFKNYETSGIMYKLPEYKQNKRFYNFLLCLKKSQFKYQKDTIKYIFKKYKELFLVF